MAEIPANGIDYTKDPRFSKKEQGDLVIPNGINYATDPRFSKPVNGINYATDPRFSKKEQGDLVVPNGIDYSKDPRFSKVEEKPFRVYTDEDYENARNKVRRMAEYAVNGSITIKPSDHFTHKRSVKIEGDPNTYDDIVDKSKAPSTIDLTADGRNYGVTPKREIADDALYSVNSHFTYDANDPFADNENAVGLMQYKDGSVEPIFSAAMTLVNPTANEKKERILKQGAGEIEDEQAIDANGTDFARAPTSPFHPFLRMDPLIARKTNLIAYNRTHTPVADLEFRKCFRHVFITRPECYIMCNEGKLSEQAEYDEDFASTYSRLPYILEILSPRYLSSHSNLSSDGLKSNWNFLLSNRVQGLNFESIENNVIDGVAKTTYGARVSPSGAQSTGFEGSLQLTFRDTKHFEVYEMIRMWMLYISKRHRGIFSPPFNGYNYHNDFLPAGTAVGDKVYLHPYDRALEYPCTIFDIITDETDTRILHYNEYVGVYPYQLSLPINNDQANAITSEMKVTVSFRYSARLVNTNSTLVHFNYNAGVTNGIGAPTSTYLNEVLPFLISSEQNNLSSNAVLTDYIGQSSLFTGSPFIVMSEARLNPVNKGATPLYSPFLKFAPVTMMDINMDANMGLTNEVTSDKLPVGVEIDQYEIINRISYAQREQNDVDRITAELSATRNDSQTAEVTGKKKEAETVGEILEETASNIISKSEKLGETAFDVVHSLIG